MVKLSRHNGLNSPACSYFKMSRIKLSRLLSESHGQQDERHPLAGNVKLAAVEGTIPPFDLHLMVVLIEEHESLHPKPQHLSFVHGRTHVHEHARVILPLKHIESQKIDNTKGYSD